MMLAVNSDLVKKDNQPQAVFALTPPALMSIGRYYDPGYTLDKIAPKGLVSYSEKATPGIGEMLLDKSSTALSEQILKPIAD